MFLTVCYNSEIKKLPCFEDELVPEFHMEKCRRWYEKYRDEMKQAMQTDENNKNESANEVIQKYKQVRSSIQCKDLSNRLYESSIFC